MFIFQTLSRLLCRFMICTRFHWTAVLLLTLQLCSPAVRAQVQIVSTGNRSIIRLAADTQRPVVYGLNPGGGGFNASLVAFDTTNGTIVKELTLAASPTDFALAPAEDALYVIHYGINQISRVDLASFKVSAKKPFPAPGNWAGGGGVPAQQYDLAAGPNGTLYYVDAAWGPVVHRFDFPSGQEKGGSDLSFGVGDIALSQDGKSLFTWAQYGWSAGSANSYVSRVDVSGAGFPVVDLSFSSARRDPLDTPVLLTASEDRIFNKQQAFNAKDLSKLLVTFSENVYAISLHGEVAVGTQHVFNALTGAQIYALPFPTTVAAFSGDQRELFLFDPTIPRLALIPARLFGTISGPGLQPTPADGSAAPFNLATLAWSPSPIALRYEVYLGTDRDEVFNANPDSAAFVGRIEATALNLTNSLAIGQRHYWRVDAVGFTSTSRGAVWSFDVAPAAVSPAKVALQAVASFSPAPISLQISAAPGTAWKATDASPWFDVSPGEGTGTGTVSLNFKTVSLATGLHTNFCTVESGGTRLTVPVVLEVLPLNIRRMAADFSRPYIYAIQAPATGQSQNSLLFINTDTEQIEKVLPMGSNLTDLSISYTDGRLYVADWGHTPTYVVDLETRELVQPLQLGTDVYRINAAGPGKIIVEGEDQWIGGTIYDTASGQRLGSLPYPVREGDGEASPLGDFYYHCDNNISNAHLHKYGVTGSTVAEVAASLEHPYGSRNLILSGDGSRLFWRGFIYDANLNELGNLGAEVYATTLRGELAFGDTKVFNTANGQAIFTLPFTTGVLAVAGKQDKVFLFNPGTGTLSVLPMSQIAPVPGPGLNPDPADGATVNLPLARLSWTTSPLAIRYAVYFGSDSNRVATATATSPEFRAEVTVPQYPLTDTLAADRDYFWRVDQVGFFGTVTGAVWSFHPAPVTVSPQQVALRGVAGLPVTGLALSITSAVPGVAWKLTEDLPWLTVSATSGVTPAKVKLGVDSAQAPGSYHGEVHVTAGGRTLNIPVSLELIQLKLTRMVADRERPFVYGLHPGSGNFDDAFVVVINAQTELVERVIPAGANPTDLSIGYADRRLYVSNWQRNATRVFSLDTWQELPPLALGLDVYRVNAAGPGKIVTEGQDQWIAGSIYDSATGQLLGNLPYPVRQGDGEATPLGDYYYHCDDNISNAHIHKYRLAGGAATEVAASAEHAFGSRNLILCEDGSRLFWRGFIYDAGLNELGGVGEEIYAATPDGRFAFGAQTVYDTETRQANYQLPFSTEVMAVAGQAGKLFLFNPASARIATVVIGAITNRPPLVENAVFSFAEDTSVVLDLKASDPENDLLTLILVSPPVHGQISTNSGRWVYTPATNYNGLDTLSFSAADRWRTSAIALVSLNVTPVNDPPVAYGQDLLVPAKGSRPLQLTGADAEGSPLVFNVISGPLHGQVTGTLPGLNYRPVAGFTGVDQFTFVANDGNTDSAPATIRLTVAPPLCLPPAEGLISWWRGDLNLEDAVGGYPLQTGGAPLFRNGKAGYAFGLRGTNRFSVKAAPRLNLGNNQRGFTVDAWINPTAGGAPRQTLVSWTGATGNSGLQLSLLAPNAGVNSWVLQLSVVPVSGPSIVLNSSYAVVDSMGFQHVAVTYDHASGLLTTYRNGAVVRQAAVGQIAIATDGVLAFGQLPTSPGYGFTGALDELAVHDRALSVDEIVDLVAADSAGRCFTPQAPVVIAGPESQNLLGGQPLVLSVEATGTGPLTFQWLLNGTNLPGANGPVLERPATLELAGSYSVMVSNAVGSVTSPAALVSVNLLANGSFETGDLSGWIKSDLPQPFRAMTLGPANVNPSFGFFRSQPTDGRYCLLHGWDAESPGTISLAQDVMVPAAGAALSFDYRAAWNLKSYGPVLYSRTFRVVVEPAGGGEPLASYPILTATKGTIVMDTGKQTGSLDLSAFAGRQIRLCFLWTVPESSTGPAFFELDNVALAFTAPAAPVLLPSGISRRPDGGMLLEFDAPAGRAVTVMASDDLVHWTPLGNSTVTSGNHNQFLDSSAKGTQQRFYRLDVQ